MGGAGNNKGKVLIYIQVILVSFIRLEQMTKQDVLSKLPRGVGVYWRVTRRLEVTFTMCHQTRCYASNNIDPEQLPLSTKETIKGPTMVRNVLFK